MNEDIRNPYWDGNNLVCEYNHPILGWVPFTTFEGDTDETGQMIWNTVDRENLPLSKPITPEQRIKEIQDAVQNLLDLKAQEKMYDNGFAVCSYATSTDETFRNEAQAFIEWRDKCWRKCYEILAQFESGEIEMPSVEYVMSQLPVLEW